MQHYISAFKNYANFSGRTSRMEYWIFVLYNMFFAVFCLILDNLTGLAFEGIGIGALYILYATLVLVPGLAIMVRRLHDIGQSGKMVLLAFLPVIGTIWLLVLFFRAGDEGDNRYGPNTYTYEFGSFISTETRNKVLTYVISFLIINQIVFSIANNWLYQDYEANQGIINTIFYFSNLFWAFVPMTLSLLIKNERIQQVLIGLSALYLIYDLQELIIRIITDGAF